MKAIPYLYFNGNGQQAIDLYQKVFKADEPQIMRYKDQASPGLRPEHENLIMHAELIFGDNIIYISDSGGDTSVVVGDNLQINLNCDSEEEIRSIYEQLSDGGHIRMALQDTFWGAIFGSLTDPFGITWSMNYQKPQE